MKYCTCLEDLKKETFYNNIRKQDYPLSTDYLKEIEITSCDYKSLVRKYKDVPNVVFLIDPPYLSTDVGTYHMNWKLSDYLDVLSILVGKAFIYFTSNKSSIIELCCWMGNHPNIGNPFENATKAEFNARMNYNSTYTDIMLYKSND